MKAEIRKYLGEIGARGGRAGKGTKLRARLNRRAAKIRWKRTKHGENSKHGEVSRKAWKKTADAPDGTSAV